MPSTSVKKLHLAKSMKELEAGIAVDFKNRSTGALSNAACKVFQAAEVSYLDKDEEKSYVQYMRFVDLLLKLQRRPDFSKDPNHKCLKEYANPALAKAEILKESLLKRYSILEEAACRKENERNELISRLHKNNVENTESSDSKLLPAEDTEIKEPEHSISSVQLHSLLTSLASLKPLVVIMDVRRAKDYEESHIKSSRCINIPEEILTPGITAAALESQLPKESLAGWYKRSEVDHVIIIDSDSKDESTQNVHVNALKQAMSKWDQKCSLKNPPLILQGGYKDWMLKYPMYTTQVLNYSLMNIRTSPVVTDLSAVEYPDLDENSAGKPIASVDKGNVNGYMKPSTMITGITNGFSAAPNDMDNRKTKSAPLVDRKSKPNIDRGLKSSGAEKRQIISNASAAVLKESGVSLPETKQPPLVIPRKSKPSVSPTLEKKTLDSNEAISDSLNKQESLAKENLELTKQQLKNEEEFEKLRLRKELEAEESKRIEIQKQEDILLEKIRQLELESQEKDTAFIKIKEENLKFKKLLEEHLDKDYQNKEKEITDAMKKRKTLMEDVERLREQRKKKEAQAKKKAPVSKGNVPRETVSANSGLKRNTNYQDQDNPKPANSSDYIVPLSRENSTDNSSRGLVRSHSSPNIAQMVNQEENMQRKVPLIDRSLKPKVTPSYQVEINRARLRNLNPVYGNCPVPPATGLRNLGNTCFMNSIIQCLSNTIPLADYINSGQYLEDINRDNKQGTGGELAEEFVVVIRALWMGQYKSFSPKDFKNIVSRCLSVCIGNEQQDSHEFLVVLMEKLHADLNKKCVKVVPKLESNVDENAFWLHHKSYNKSKISNIFEGLLKSTLTCMYCRKTSDSFEVFSCLSLPILNYRCSLKDCFQHFLKSEKISGEAAWDCPRCKQKKDAEKRLRICRLPEVLIIQLKRFSYEGLWRRKLQTHVDFDLIFDVPCEENSEEKFRSYSLYGIVNHYGTLEGGHYTAYCKSTTRKWYKYDDHEVSEISSSDIKTSAAYMLFYCSSDLQSNL